MYRYIGSFARYTKASVGLGGCCVWSCTYLGQECSEADDGATLHRTRQRQEDPHRVSERRFRRQPNVRQRFTEVFAIHVAVLCALVSFGLTL